MNVKFGRMNVIEWIGERQSVFRDREAAGLLLCFVTQLSPFTFIAFVGEKK